jgi:hypothetical protein
MVFVCYPTVENIDNNDLPLLAKARQLGIDPSYLGKVESYNKYDRAITAFASLVQRLQLRSVVSYDYVFQFDHAAHRRGPDYLAQRYHTTSAPKLGHDDLHTGTLIVRQHTSKGISPDPRPMSQ